MDLFTIAAKLKMDTSDFDASVNGAISSGNALKNKLSKGFSAIKKAAAAAVSVAVIKKGIDAVTGLANAVAEAGDRIDKQSQALGMSRQAYQEWDYILSQSGSSIDSLGTSMKTLNTAITSGSKDSAAALQKLGLSSKQLGKMSQEAAFEKVVKAFQKLPEGAEKSALAVKLFGRNGQELLPLLNSTAGSIDDLKNKAKELGLIMSDDAVDASVKYTDALDTLKRTFNGLKFNIGAKLLPVFTDITEKVTKYIAKLRKAFEKGGVINVLKVVVKDIKASWPTWEDVKKGAENAWKAIKSSAEEAAARILGAMGLDVVAKENADGSHEFIKWPTWDDVKAAAEKAWNDLKAKAEAFFKEAGGIVFGKKENGEVAWPTWEDVKAKAEAVWKAIKDEVKKLGGLIFGKKEDGSVAWPTWETVKTKAKEAWRNIKAGAKLIAEELGGLVFGRADDGTVAWPDLNKLVDDFGTWWNDTALPALKGAINWALPLFGVPTETAEKISSVIGDWWSGKVQAAQSVLKWLIGLPDTPNPYKSGVELRKILTEWWEKVKANLGNILSLLVGVSGMEDADGTKTQSVISSWWTNTVAPLLKGIFNFTLGMFGLDDLDTIKGKFEEAGKEIKTYIIDPLVGFYDQHIAPIVTGIENAIQKIRDFLGLTDDDAMAMDNLNKGKEVWEEYNQQLIDGTANAETANLVLEAMNGTMDESGEITQEFLLKLGLLAKKLEEEKAAAEEADSASEGVGTASENAKSKVSNFKKELGATELKIANVASAAQSLGESINNLPTNKTITVTSIFRTYHGGGAGASDTERVTGQRDSSRTSYTHAKGAWDIPYDNYPALLHRNEMVLTSSQARQYREGQSGGVNLGALTSAIVGAVREGMRNAQVNAYMDGKEVTDNVSRRMANEFKAMRYAT